ncbi:helix-turn-helix transcriptional regulator [Olivibacter ginsenosidimutans]
MGRNFAKHRKFREKMLLKVAEHLGMTEANYSKYERGENKITVEIIQGVAEFLNVDPLQLNQLLIMIIATYALKITA